MTRLPVSVAVPVFNEESNLPSCLSRLSAFDEVVLIDSGSIDQTPQIAQEFGVILVQFDWSGGFPKKRNWLLQTYTFRNPWVLFLDADECVTPDFTAELAAVLPGTEHAGFILNYQNFFMGRLLKYGDRMRKRALFRVGAGEYERIEEDNWSSLPVEVHEHPVLTGSIGEIKAPILHEDYKGLHSYIAKHNEYSSWEANRFLKLRSSGTDSWSQLTARQQQKYRHLRKWWFAPAYFCYAYIWKGGFRDGREGFIFWALKMIYFLEVQFKIFALRKAAVLKRGN